MKSPIYNLVIFIVDQTIYEKHRWNNVFLHSLFKELNMNIYLSHQMKCYGSLMK
jgi:hypothetical protein